MSDIDPSIAVPVLHRPVAEAVWPKVPELDSTKLFYDADFRNMTNEEYDRVYK